MRESIAKKTASSKMYEGPVASQIIRFAIPLFIGNLFQQMYSTADALIVGNLLCGKYGLSADVVPYYCYSGYLLLQDGLGFRL